MHSTQPQPTTPKPHLLPVHRRSRAIAALSDTFASAFGTARGGFVRDTLVAGYPRLAGLLEGAVAHALRDSATRDVAPALDEEQVGEGDEQAGQCTRCHRACCYGRGEPAAAACSS